MLTPAICSKVDALWDRFWSGGIANPLTVIEQITYLLFMRRLDALDRKKAEDAEWPKEKHVSLFKGHESCRWSRFKNLPGDEMLSHVRDKVFPFIKGLGGEDQALRAVHAGRLLHHPEALAPGRGGGRR